MLSRTGGVLHGLLLFAASSLTLAHRHHYHCPNKEEFSSSSNNFVPQPDGCFTSNIPVCVEGHYKLSLWTSDENGGPLENHAHSGCYDLHINGVKIVKTFYRTPRSEENPCWYSELSVLVMVDNATETDPASIVAWGTLGKEIDILDYFTVTFCRSTHECRDTNGEIPSLAISLGKVAEDGGLHPAPNRPCKGDEKGQGPGIHGGNGYKPDPDSGEGSGPGVSGHFGWAGHQPPVAVSGEVWRLPERK